MDAKLAARLVAALAEAKVNAVLATQTHETPVPDYMVAVAPQQTFNVRELVRVCEELGFDVWFDQDGQWRIVPPPDFIPEDVEEVEVDATVCVCPPGYRHTQCPLHGDAARKEWFRTRTPTDPAADPRNQQARTAENNHMWGGR